VRRICRNSICEIWHAGLLVPSLIALYWTTWGARKQRCSSGRLVRLEHTAIIYAVLVQCAWTVHALAYDYAQAYAPDQETGRVLRPYVRQKTTDRGGDLPREWNWSIQVSWDTSLRQPEHLHESEAAVLVLEYAERCGSGLSLCTPASSRHHIAGIYGIASLFLWDG
jgi:hypothetical protein